MAKYDWNEERQAHWVARRTLADLRLRVEMTSYFQTCDMLYPNEDGSPGGRLNSKGLLRRSDYTPKPAYFVYQCLCALFDAESQWAELPLDLSAADGQTLDTAALWKAAFLRRGKPLHAYWLPADLRQEFSRRSVDLAIPETSGTAIDVPVLIDPLNATVYRLPQAARSQGRLRVAGVPLTDYPLLVTDRSVVELA